MKYCVIVKAFYSWKGLKELKSIEKKEKKILTVVFMLLFNYLDTLPKL